MQSSCFLDFDSRINRISLISTEVRVPQAADPKSTGLEVRLGDEARTGLLTLAIPYKSCGYDV